MNPFGKYSDGALILRFEGLQEDLANALEHNIEEDIVLFENQLAQCGFELLRRSIMDANHQTRLFIGGD